MSKQVKQATHPEPEAQGTTTMAIDKKLIGSVQEILDKVVLATPPYTGSAEVNWLTVGNSLSALKYHWIELTQHLAQAAPDLSKLAQEREKAQAELKKLQADVEQFKTESHTLSNQRAARQTELDRVLADLAKAKRQAAA